MLLDKLSSLNVVLSKLTQQERQFLSLETTSYIQILAAPTNSLNTVMTSQGRGRGRGRGGRFQAGGRGRGGRTRMQCSFCDKTGHTVDMCYKEHGLPPHLRQRNTNSAPVMMNYFNIGEATEDRNDGLGFNHPQLEEKKTIGSDFTPEQKEALLALLNKQEVQHIHSMNYILTQPQPPPHGDNLFEIERVKQTLHDRFRIKDIGDLKFFLGLEVARSSKG
ncbi:uncharacterized protein LOC127744166 [Arachis duranensis]|uniref:Uncharacterized protein LOC110274601 n=1 Tax=Arachis duranensis TaxID=130453 RepID=A0A9C6WM20_ARADU|nr:uncharacterized protein LOC110274601 [Arachis duranensis]XP_052112407.1 uncharacterized protein LOC127744166 [Arachis duranensis]